MFLWSLIRCSVLQHSFCSPNLTLIDLTLDKEPPKVHNCDASNQYITISGQQGIVRWNEPSFTDNTGIHKKLVSLENGKVRQAHTYYVDYSVIDKSGNANNCRFFVHVQGMWSFLFSKQFEQLSIIEKVSLPTSQVARSTISAVLRKFWWTSVYRNKGRFCNYSRIVTLISKRLYVENKAKLSQLETENTYSAVLFIYHFQLREFRFVLYR